MTWWEAVPTLLAVLVVVFVPGLAVLAALGVRGLPLGALAPGGSAAVLGGGAVLAGFAGVPWQPVVAIASVVLAVAVAFLLGRWRGAPEILRRPLPVTGGRILAVGAAGAALVAAVPLAIGLRRPDHPPQTWDSVFHLNALRYIEDTGNASTFLLGGLMRPVDGTGFYPAGWHVLGGTVVDSLGSDPAAVANLMTLVLAGLVIPLGTALASRALMPEWRWAAGVGAVTGSVFGALPVMMVTFGTVWPNAWATGLLPALLGASLLCLRHSDVSSWLAVLVAGAGAVLIHPSVVFGFALLGSPLALQALGRRWQRLHAAGRRRRPLVEGGVLGAVALGGLLLMTSSSLLDSVRRYRWGQPETMAQALGEALVDAPLSQLGHGLRNASWVLGGLLVLGVVHAAGNRQQWAWVWSLALAVGAFAIAAGAPEDSILRDYVTGYWYNDPVRLAGHVPVVAAPLVAVGLRAVVEWLAARLPRRLSDTPRAASVVSLVGVPVVVLTFLIVTGGGYAHKRADRIVYDYWTTSASNRQLVTAAEEDLLRSLDETLPEDAVILSDPFSGGALAYALGDREVVFPHMTGAWTDTALRAVRLMPDLDDPRTCELLQELGAEYLYVDRHMYLEGGPVHQRFQNLDEVPQQGVELLERAGSAALYEITACR